jgi:hypothetical protein
MMTFEQARNLKEGDILLYSTNRFEVNEKWEVRDRPLIQTIGLRRIEIPAKRDRFTFWVFTQKHLPYLTLIPKENNDVPV